MDKIISIKDLSVSFSKKEVLRSINLDIERNRITAIIGPSGCGKSTLLKTINSMTQEEKTSHIKGRILFNGVDTTGMGREELRRKVGLVFQNPTPFPLSVYKNMTYGPIYHGLKDKKALGKLVEDKLKATGLYEEIKDDINMSALKLSGGQQQRLCIARALSIEPEVMLLDEPCSALDIKNTSKIENMLVNLSRDYTIIIVTHNLSQAKRISDYTAFMLNGEMIEFGKTEELFSNPKDKRTKDYVEGIYG